MESTRQNKIARLIQKDLSEIFLKYPHTLLNRERGSGMGGVLISVSEVRISPDLAIAHIYLSIFPDDKATLMMEHIEEDKGMIRGQLGTLERHQLRIIPELLFHLDDTISRMEHIDELLRS